jgi:hypothetical protein
MMPFLMVGIAAIGILALILLVRFILHACQPPPPSQTTQAKPTPDYAGPQATLHRIRSRIYNLLQTEGGVAPAELIRIEDDNMKDIRYLLTTESTDTLTHVLPELYSGMALLRPQALAVRTKRPHDQKLSESLAKPLAAATVQPDVIHRSVHQHQKALALSNADVELWNLTS